MNKYSRELPKKDSDAHLVNEGIRVREVMVVDGEVRTVMNTRVAMNEAFERGLDLVLVAPNAKPPVAKFMDYNKHKYEQQRRQREARKNQKVVEIKELRLSPTIDIGDFNTKLKNGRKFLEQGNKLKISIRFRGREMAYTNQGREVISRFAKECEDLATISSKPLLEGRSMFAMLTPIKDKKQ